MLLRLADLSAGYVSHPTIAEWGVACDGRPEHAIIEPASQAAVEFDGPGAAVVSETLGDYGTRGTQYVDVVRGGLRCGSYTGADVTGRIVTMTVTPIPTAEIVNRIDTGNGAIGVGASISDPRGRHTYLVWIIQGDLVVRLRDSDPSATPAASIQLGERALERLKDALG